MTKIILAVIMLFIVILVLTVSSQNQTIESFAICGRHHLNRVDIWERTRKRIGIDQASKIMPMTLPTT